MSTLTGSPANGSKDDTGCNAKRIRRVVEVFQRGVDKERNFEILFKCFYLRLLRFFARRRVFSPEEREDLTQETLWRVYKGLGKFRGQATFTTWLYGIANNNHHRWRQRQASAARRLPQVFVDTVEDLDRLLSDEDVPFRVAALRSPEEDFQRRERDRRLAQAIQELPERMRRCVELRVEGLKYHEIAEVMQIDRGAVGAHLAQARKKLVVALETDRAGKRISR